MKRFKLSFLAASILYVILGGLLLAWPGIGGIALCQILGTALLLYGLVDIIAFLLRDRAVGGFYLELFFGIIAAVVGLSFLLRPLAMFQVLSMAVGLYVIVDALVALSRAVSLCRYGYRLWWVSLLLSLLGIALGVVLFRKPFAAAEMVTMLIGGAFLFLGISDLWSLWKLSRVMKLLRDAGPIDEDPLDIQ
ncbi:HdeD family acid-resistance protein [Pseudoflavonifractor sp. MSJ-37]|uniref:HdeD family acid-resistance protein n=1 Tax=Pseudoflavonifractor sp. MSJ-37 TaxID=2841531 RepID=UPI001C11963D|nr:DUF308 domain-containing protein [Pseudoflavonifractor sp. MSJ-37]MBU5434614.1 DUF308 domain-containing protein [Pseudoflavonifractor sp. MSJ-37]